MRRHTAGQQLIVILRRNDTATDDDDVVGAFLFQAIDDLRDQRFVSRGLRGDADHVHVVLDRLAHRLVGGLKKRSDIDVETDIGKRRGDHLGTAIVSVLTELADQHAWPATLGFGELDDRLANGRQIRHRSRTCAVHTCNGLGHGAMAPVDFLQRIGNLADGGPGTCSIDGECQQIAGLLSRAASVNASRALLQAASSLVAADLRETPDLGLAHGRVVDAQNVDVGFFSQLVLVNADDRLFTAVDACLALYRRFFDAQLGHAGLDRPGHAAHLLDFVDELARLFRQLIGQAFHVVGTGQRIHDLGDAGFLLQHQLGVSGDACRKLGGQRERLIEGIGVQRLRAAEDGCHGLDRRAHDVRVRALGGQTDARGLAVRAQHQRPAGLAAKTSRP